MKALPSSVSRRSSWEDDIWYLDRRNPATRNALLTINWDFAVDPGRSFLDAEFKALRASSKLIMWTLFKEPGERAKAWAPSHVAQKFQSFRRLLRWMISESILSIAELDEAACDRYADTFLDRIRLAHQAGVYSSGQTIPDELTFNHVLFSLSIIESIWRQRGVLARYGIKAMPKIPFGGKSAALIAKAVIDRKSERIPPIPDEVAVIVLNAASTMTEPCVVNDLTTLRDICLAPKVRSLRAKLEGYRFSRRVGEKRSWRGRLGWNMRLTPYCEGPRSTGNAMQELRQQIMYVSAAAIILVQAATGLRNSEICAIRQRTDYGADLPSCLTIELSPSGMYEFFILTTSMSKGGAVPQPIQVLVGARVRGTSVLPLGVAALLVLRDLWAPWRKGNEDALVLRFDQSKSFSSVSTLKNDNLSRDQKAFILEHCKFEHLPDQSKDAWIKDDILPYKKAHGTNIRPHQWRKTLANFALKTDRGLLPALAMQFNHVSVAITEGFYSHNNRQMIEDVDNMQRQRSSALLYAYASGRANATGRMGDALRQDVLGLSDRVEGLSEIEGRKEIFKWVSDKGVRIWEAVYGECLPLKSSEMRCHQAAGTAHHLNRKPNLEARRSDVCLGCRHFIISVEHVPYWIQRHKDYSALMDVLDNKDIDGPRHVTSERVKQSRLMLQLLGAEPAE